MDPYRVRFTFFWYNDEEIFHDTQEDIDRKIKAVADQGITHIITFSCTHFRWSFEPWWDKIHECLAKIVKAGHKYGLKVIEHHSSELAHYPYNEEYLTFMKRCLQGRHSSIDSWPGIVELALKEDGPALRWTQKSHVTGKPNITNYCATNKCYNNPDYVKAYLSYLEKVYATGVDGIMTDDVQYFCHCQCEHCRRLFQEKTSFRLPEAGTGEWDEWFGNMSDPSFLAWLAFRFQSTQSFHEKVAAHYESLGLKLLRPNYLSFGITHDWTAYSLEKIPRLDWYFQECARANSVRYSLPKVLSEQAQRAMVARKRKIPHGILFYAYDEDELVYTWGAAMLAGAFYINTPEGSRTPVDETKIRRFEERFGDILFHGEPMGCVGFLDSPENRFFAPCYNMSRMEFFLQSCIFWNIPCKMVSSLEPESWENCSVISVNEVHCLGDGEIEALKAFAARGKFLILSGPTGIQKADHSPRSREEREKIWGFSSDLAEGEKLKIIPYGKGKIALLALDYGYPGSREELEKMFGDPMRYKYGEHPDVDSKHIHGIHPPWQRDVNVRKESPVKELYLGFLEKKEEILALFRALFAGKEPFAAQLPEGVLAAPFITENEKGFSIRLLNMKGAMIPPGNGNTISRADPIPWEKWDGGDGTFVFRLSGEKKGKEYEAVFHTLDGSIVLPDPKKEGEKLFLTLPAGLLRDFGLIVLTPKAG